MFQSWGINDNNIGAKTIFKSIPTTEYNKGALKRTYNFREIVQRPQNNVLSSTYGNVQRGAKYTVKKPPKQFNIGALERTNKMKQVVGIPYTTKYALELLDKSGREVKKDKPIDRNEILKKLSADDVNAEVYRQSLNRFEAIKKVRPLTPDEQQYYEDLIQKIDQLISNPLGDDEGLKELQLERGYKEYEREEKLKEMNEREEDKQLAQEQAILDREIDIEKSRISQQLEDLDIKHKRDFEKLNYYADKIEKIRVSIKMKRI